MSASDISGVALSPSVLARVQTHKPTPAARRRAEAAGLDLDDLKRRDPVTYAVLNAQRAVQVAPQLREAAGEALFDAFPRHQVFDAPQTQGGLGSLLLFPPLGQAELIRLDRTFAELASVTSSVGSVFYRTVNDSGGERRELGLTVLPDAWQGQPDVMVGPFVTEAAARAWSERHVAAPSGLVSDVLRYAGAWFCDLFWGDTLSS